MRIAVLLGGNSAERDVSLESGRNVAEALQHRGHKIVRLDPSLERLDSLRGQVDAILPMLHGTGAEDGSLQRQLEHLQIPWLGSSSEASALTFNKVATRRRLQSCGLPVPPGMAFHRTAPVSSIEDQILPLGSPVVIKPASQGSSVGVSIVCRRDDVTTAVSEALRWGDVVLIEQFITGRELTVPVIEGKAFPPVEIIPSRPWYDYAAKYTDDATQYVVNPSNVPQDMSDAVIEACRVCGVTGISRTDLRLDEQGRFWILEINTIPGMTSHSLVPMSAAALGLSIGELCESLLLNLLLKKSRGRPDDTCKG
ncbi:MAG: D-alanine--D-alanine ligase [Planctomycetota bacterium]